MGIFKSKKNIFLLVFFVAAILYVLYALIFVSDEGNDGQGIKGYTSDEIAIYTVSDNLVKDYDTFYTMEGVASQIISALNEEKYKEVYSLIYSELKGDISKEQWIELLKQFYQDNFSDVVSSDGEEVIFSKSRILSNLYTINSQSYIMEIKNNHGSTTKIGIRIINKTNYQIIYLEF